RNADRARASRRRRGEFRAHRGPCGARTGASASRRDRDRTDLRAMIEAPRTALELAAAIRDHRLTAADVTRAALERIARRDPAINAFTEVTAERALAEAAAVDRALASGQDPGPLAGVPYAVKNLFDIAGLKTLAGSKINRDHAPAMQDAAL